MKFQGMFGNGPVIGTMSITTANVKKNDITYNPIGANKAFNPNNPYIEEKVIRGGSFLCNASYCASYRVSSRMGTDPNTSLEHLGFRTVKIKNN